MLFASVDWDPKVAAKYGMVDLDTEEISSLENMFPHIRVFLCDFHRQQSLHRHYINSYLLYLLIPKNSLLFKQNESLKCKGCLQETGEIKYFQFGVWSISYSCLLEIPRNEIHCGLF